MGAYSAPCSGSALVGNLWGRSHGCLSLSLTTVCQASSQQQRGENLSHKALSYKLLKLLMLVAGCQGAAGTLGRGKELPI